MSLLLISLYEFGQFLRILLWISLPMVIISMLVTTWLHYRRKRKIQDSLVLSMDGLDLSADAEVLMAAMRRLPITATGESEAGADAGEVVTKEEKENMYRGILWMKEKYEQYRDLADKRYEQLKEALLRSEKKYEALLASGEANKFQEGTTHVAVEAAPEQLDQRIENNHQMEQESIQLRARLEELEAQHAEVRQQLELREREAEELDKLLEVQRREFEEQGNQLDEERRRVNELEGILRAEQKKTEDLMTKLQGSSTLLLNICQELDKTLHPAAE